MSWRERNTLHLIKIAANGFHQAEAAVGAANCRDGGLDLLFRAALLKNDHG
ncbi:MAG: hypothetical protein PSY12_09400 [bacterium]|nr:hypothetical protein [bacterium]